MKNVIAGISLLALLTGCSATQVATTTTSICSDVAAAEANPTVVALLNKQSPTSALGVLWADAKAGCAGSAPATGVTESWISEVFGELEALAPTLLPILVGLI